MVAGYNVATAALYPTSLLPKVLISILCQVVQFKSSKLALLLLLSFYTFGRSKLFHFLLLPVLTQTDYAQI